VSLRDQYGHAILAMVGKRSYLVAGPTVLYVQVTTLLSAFQKIPGPCRSQEGDGFVGKQESSGDFVGHFHTS